MRLDTESFRVENHSPKHPSQLVRQLINLEIAKALWGWHIQSSCDLLPAVCLLFV